MDPDVIRFQKYKWAGPLYYNYPDGEDLGGKLSFCGQMGFFLSAPVGVINAYIRQPYPTSQMGRFVRVLRAVIPGVGMGLAFAATTYYSTKIRQKDDWINHCIGGVAAGTILGAATNLRNGVAASIFLASMAGVLKHKDPEEKTCYKRKLPNYLLRSKDLSNIPYKGDNWVKAPPPEN